MKKTLLLLIAALMCAFNAVALDEDTELNCDVEVNSDKITSGSKDVFDELKEAISNYINDWKWTKAVFSTNEKIYCKMLLTISEYDNGIMKGDLQIQSTRPVYNSSYTTTIINFKDNKVNFSFRIGQELNHNEFDIEDNLTAILDFWVNIILALDFDTFELKGGDPYFDEAARIVRLAQSLGESGWKPFEDNTNRNAVLSAFTETKTEPIRQLLYEYHRLGLDQMALTVDKGRATITHTLENLGKIYDVAPVSVCLTMFKDSKLDELVNIYSKANLSEKEAVYEMLYQVYPSETNKLEQIKQEYRPGV